MARKIKGLTATVLLCAMARVAGAAGMDVPVQVPDIVVDAPPVEAEPVYNGGYRPDPGTTAVAEVARAPEVAKRDSGGSGGNRSGTDSQISMAPDGRVPCFTVAKARRGGAGPFALCQP